ncbi:ABC transporter permease [Candidatus Frankia alpina]|uniref:ABC transporter permease n=1 Tax=Candidatus Frankia alpina TaxID=2699483 RepID=UPI001F20E16E|nr:ABC transporter permease [Candidatus Frankia alpina]
MSDVAEVDAADVDAASAVHVARREERRSPVPFAASAFDLLTRLSPLVLLVSFLIVFSILKPAQFATWDNFSAILYASSVSAIIGLAMTVSFTAGEVDISVGAVMGVAAMFTAWAFGHGWPTVAAVAGALAVGAAIGLVNAVLIVVARLNSFITTLGMITALGGLAYLIGDGKTLYEGIPVSFNHLVGKRVLNLLLVIFYTLILAVVLGYLISRTPFGRRLRATGTGREAAALIGVRTSRYITISPVLGATLAALAGVARVAELQSANPSIGTDFLLNGVAAVFLGALVSRRGQLNVWGTLLAVVMLRVGLTGLTMVGAPAWVPNVFNGSALLAALLISRAGSGGGPAGLGNLK